MVVVQWNMPSNYNLKLKQSDYFYKFEMNEYNPIFKIKKPFLQLNTTENKVNFVIFIILCVF